MARVIKMSGEKVELGPLMREDMGQFFSWVNDYDIAKYLANMHGIRTVEDEVEWFDSARRDPNREVFALLEKSTGRLIGNCTLMNIDRIHRSAEYGILIGEKDCWGKGYGHEATALVAQYGFATMNLHSIYLKLFSYMQQAQKMFERVGYRVVGTRRESLYFNGKYYDEIIMDLLNREFDFEQVKRTLAGRY